MKRPRPNVAESLRDAHATLLADLRQLEAATQPPSPEDQSELLTRLRSMRKHVTEHFRFEEQNGYMDAVRKRQPRLERTIEELATEHRELSQVLEDLIAQGVAAASSHDGFCNKIAQWIARLRKHETRENELVQDSFNLDIAAED
jgi:hemerythrin-like domain-containing protein